MTADQDLWLVAHHEAAHAVVAEHLNGRPATIELWREAPPAGGGKSHRGRCRFAPPASAVHDQLISLAGAIGETLASADSGSSGPALVAATMRRLSVSDAIGAGWFDVPKLDQCLRLIRTLWPRIAARAQQEIFLFNQRAA